MTPTPSEVNCSIRDASTAAKPTAAPLPLRGGFDPRDVDIAGEDA